jgi:REP-associated tyrosine transposase
MPRPLRNAPAGVIFHVLNRGNARANVFHKPRDYTAFLELLSRARKKASVDVLGWCLMPNHVHLVLRPAADDSLSRYMQWLLTTHAHRYRASRADTGHVWQGRFKSCPVETDRYFITVLRYVERNPVGALVARAEDWPWSSLRERITDSPSRLLTASPVELADHWTNLVNEPLTSRELARVRDSVRRGRPFGDPAWEREMIETLALESTVRATGRPRRKTVPDPFRMTS